MMLFESRRNEGGFLRGFFPALLLIALAMILPARLRALPRFSLLTGTRCSACHFNPQGSGIRNELGWSTMNQVGAIQPSMVGLDSLFAAESNSFWNGLVTVGMDVRLQYANFGDPSGKSEIKVMQLSPELAIQPFDELTAYGSFNFADRDYLNDIAVPAYPGQATFDVAVQYQPGITLPSIRVGHIQPSVGLRHDDHTMFVRQQVNQYTTLPVLPPNYNEWGAEVTYEGTRDFTVNAGVFTAKNLGRNFSLGVDSTKLSFSGRVIYWPQILDEGLNGIVGGSVLANGDFSMINAFAGVGLSDRAAIYGEGMFGKSTLAGKFNSMMVYGTYQIAPWLSLEGRYEWGTGQEPESDAFDASSFVIGSQFFIFPYFELRPEYRVMKTAAAGSDGQFALQAHLFY